MDKIERQELGVNGRIDKYKQTEQAFVDWYNQQGKNWSIYDVSDIKEYQEMDIDFVLYRGSLACAEETILYDTNTVLESLEYCPVEVKASDNIEKYKELCFELAADNRTGWTYRCKAKYVFYISIDEDGDPLRAFVVDFGLWRQYCSKSCTPKKQHFKDGMADFFCKIDDLKQHGVIIKEVYF